MPERREFYTTYARYYDRIYAAVDYDAQVEAYVSLYRARRGAQADVLVGDARALDLCCGTGRHALALLDRGWSSFACDLSPEMVRITQGKHSRLRVARTDLRALPFRGPFDLVLCSCNSLLESSPLEALWRTIEEVHSILSPGGVFIFDLTDQRIGLGGDESHGVYEDGPLRYEVRWTWREGEPVLHALVSLQVREEGRMIGFEDDHHLCAVTIPDLAGILDDVGFDLLLLEDDTDDLRPWLGESMKALFVATRR